MYIDTTYIHPYQHYRMSCIIQRDLILNLAYSYVVSLIVQPLYSYVTRCLWQKWDNCYKHFSFPGFEYNWCLLQLLSWSLLAALPLFHMIKSIVFTTMYNDDACPFAVRKFVIYDNLKIHAIVTGPEKTNHIYTSVFQLNILAIMNLQCLIAAAGICWFFYQLWKYHHLHICIRG